MLLLIKKLDQLKFSPIHFLLSNVIKSLHSYFISKVNPALFLKWSSYNTLSQTDITSEAKVDSSEVSELPYYFLVMVTYNYEMNIYATSSWLHIIKRIFTGTESREAER